MRNSNSTFPSHISDLFDVFFSMADEEDFRRVHNNTLLPSYPVANHSILNNHSYKIELACTGIPEDRISIETEGDTLIIKSDGYQTVTDKEGVPHGVSKVICRNLPYRGFEQKFTCSPMMDLSKLEATIKYGVLTIIIPRKEESLPIKKEIKIG